MRLEVQIDESDPVIYVLNKPEIYVGSTPNNDIVIKTVEISRKHLKIVIADKKCYVIDQGSTNGSYMNEARLVPGRRTEFTTFESLRLGDRVYLTLLQPHQGGTLNNRNIDPTPKARTVTTSIDADKTRIISLKELHAAKTKKITKKRIEAATKKKAESKRIRAEKDALKRVLLLSLMWIGVGFGLNLVWQSLPDVVKKTYAPPIRLAKEVDIEEDELVDFTINSKELLTRAQVDTYLDKLKCVTEDELFFCSKIDFAKDGVGGAIEVEDSLIIFFPQENWILRAKAFLKMHTFSQKKPDQKSYDSKTLNKASALLFIDEVLRTIIGHDYKVRKIYVAFYTQDKKVDSIAGFNTIHLIQITKNISEEKDKLDADNGILFVNEFDKFISYF